jgi:acid phosphatase
MQTAAEYANTTRQIFRMAAERLDAARADARVSAIESVAGDPALPPAVIVDVDETILDNSPHAARLILAREGFDRERWNDWVNEASAPPVPGAVGYLRAARAAGVRVIYLTNRHHELEAATRRNLAALGCPIDEQPGEDVVLTYRERTEWSGDKTSRRLWVAERYRVLQLLGDDLNDFVAVPPRATIDYRRRLSDRYRERWGDSWFQLPNPLYGSWEQAITPDGMSIFDSPLADTIRILDTD